MSKPMTLAQQAAAELAHRSVHKSERPARPDFITPDVWKLGGAALRDLAGDLASGITTHVEAKAAERAALKAQVTSATNPPATRLEAAVAKGQTNTRRVNTVRTGPTVTVADAIVLGRANGKSIPRWLTAIAAGRPVK